MKNACQATPQQIVRETFLDVNKAKGEGEWWAANIIIELEDKHKRAWDKIEQLIQICKAQDIIAEWEGHWKYHHERQESFMSLEQFAAEKVYEVSP